MPAHLPARRQTEVLQAGDSSVFSRHLRVTVGATVKLQSSSALFCSVFTDFHPVAI